MSDIFAGKLFPETFELYVRQGEYASVASITNVVIVASLYDPDTDSTSQIPATHSVPRDGHVVALCDIPADASTGSKLNVLMTANVSGQAVQADHDVGTLVADNTDALAEIHAKLDEITVDPNLPEDFEVAAGVTFGPNNTRVGTLDCNVTAVVVSPGHLAQTVTINDDSGIPIPCACVSITTDVDGTMPISEGKADALGKYEFELPKPSPQEIYIWRSKKGFRLKNPIPISVITT